MSLHLFREELAPVHPQRRHERREKVNRDLCAFSSAILKSVVFLAKFSSSRLHRFLDANHAARNEEKREPRNTLNTRMRAAAVFPACFRVFRIFRGYQSCRCFVVFAVPQRWISTVNNSAFWFRPRLAKGTVLSLWPRSFELVMRSPVCVLGAIANK